MKSVAATATTVATLAISLVAARTPAALSLPRTASANSKYANLAQVLYCPSDRQTYGDVNDYGYWNGGSWCGQVGMAGYWVYTYPNWYVWSSAGRGPALPPQLANIASMGGKYSTLVQVLDCPRDRATYGEVSDYGYWNGGDWCGQTGVAGYWVYAYPNWYVWQGSR
ncbi:MAG: hypothetical protein AAGB13_07600 [Cyanobacteria bacterium P01_F01_bin.33]